MKSILKFTFITALLISSASIYGQMSSDAKSKSLLEALEKRNGGWDKLVSKKDVQFTYIYKDFTKGTDISKERLIFDGEASWGEYKQHEVNVMPGMDGIAKQSLVNGQPKISLGGKNVTDQMAIGGTQFLRSVNFFWFTMMYKLSDPGTIHKYLGQENINGINYDKVSLTYNPSEVGKEINDEYILYYNPKTNLIDQFFFSLLAMGIEQPVMRMELDYSKVDGVYVATTRTAFAPNDIGEYNKFIEFITKDIRFNNKFTIEDLRI